MNSNPEQDVFTQKIHSEIKEPLSTIKKLIERLEEIQKEKKRKKTSIVQISKLIKSAASLYEKVRSTIDFKEEHLLRRGAIQRIISRRLKFSQTSKTISEGLIHELIQAGYLKNDLVGTNDIKKITEIIDKYLIIINTFVSGKEQDYFIAIASVEIEEQLVSHDKEESLLQALHKNIAENIQKSKETKIDSTQLSLTLRTIFLKSDMPTLRFYLWKVHYSSWTRINVDYLSISMNRQKIIDVIRKIEADLKNPLNKKLTKQVKPYNPIFIILQKIIVQNAKAVKDIFYHPQQLNIEVRDLVDQYHTDTKAKLNRSILRAVLFILITKVILGLLIEIPYDMYFVGSINWLPLGINLVFPILLMYVSASLISIPGEKNTQKLIQEIRKVIYGRDKTVIAENKVRFSASAPINMTLKIIYLIVFISILALIIWLLAVLQFNIVSGFLFFFFVSVVSFLAFRIRQSAKDLLVIKEKEGTISNVIDFLFLPFLRIGHWMAIKFVGINVFLFFLDFIIEAPFKLILEILGHWIDFVKQKQEELDS